MYIGGLVRVSIQPRLCEGETYSWDLASLLKAFRLVRLRSFVEVKKLTRIKRI